MSRPVDVLTVDRHFEDDPLPIMLRLYDTTKTLIQQSAVDTIHIKVFDASGTQILTEINPTVSSTIFNTLQTDSGWDDDSTGFNFRYVVSGTYFPTGGVTETIEIDITPTVGERHTAKVIKVNVKAKHST